MRIYNFFEKLYVNVQDFLTFLTGGTECICCGEFALAVPLCKKCQSFLMNPAPYKKGVRCQQCGKKLISEDNLCSECLKRQTKRSLNGLFPIHSYRLWKKDLMFAWKAEDQRALSLFFAKLVNQEINKIKKQNCLDFDYLVPVPPRPGKLRKKGWDQIDELCRILKRKYSFRVENVLERYSATEQKKLSKEQRTGKEGASYGLKKDVKVTGNKVLIVDDVITTGATMEKCAKLLKQAGINEVYGTSLFIVD